MAQAKNKTQATTQSVEDFINAIEHAGKRADAHILNALFKKITGFEPRLWGPTIIGYGQYHFIYESGREGDNLATGFSPRKTNLSLYIMPGYKDLSEVLGRLGKHKIGKSCLYINKLADVDIDVLEEIIRAGLKDLDSKWPIKAS